MPQKYTDARKNGNRRWDAANLDRMSIALPKGQKDAVKAAAAAAGLSTNAYIGRVLSGEMLPPYCVRFTITDEQKKNLERMAAAYSLKLSSITPAELFETMMYTGSTHDIDEKMAAYIRMLDTVEDLEE